MLVHQRVFDETIEFQKRLKLGPSVAKPFKRVNIFEMSLDPSGIMQHWHNQRVKQILKSAVKLERTKAGANCTPNPHLQNDHSRQTQPYYRRFQTHSDA